VLTDLATVIWKEWKEFLSQRSTLLSMAVFLAIFAVLLPYQTGARWVRSPAGMINLVFVPLFLVLTVIADAFAGERERHTLDTLLASRLSDPAILFGKLAAAVLYGWGLTVAAVLLALIPAGLAAGEVVVYPALTLPGIGALSLLAIVLVGGAGILVSLRAATVRQAQQMLNLGLLGVGLLAGMAIAALPDGLRDRLRDLLTSSSTTELVLTGGATLLIVDAILLAAAVVRFRRSRLVLD
jgi:ABC-2 type transport system permease protein